jgi:hypothetical protein
MARTNISSLQHLDCLFGSLSLFSAYIVLADEREVNFLSEYCQDITWTNPRKHFGNAVQDAAMILTVSGQNLRMLATEYELPLGVLGRIVAGCLVHAKLRRMFDYRHQVVLKNFEEDRS